jgi:hypothetical protein
MNSRLPNPIRPGFIIPLPVPEPAGTTADISIRATFTVSASAGVASAAAVSVASAIVCNERCTGLERRSNTEKSLSMVFPLNE